MLPSKRVAKLVCGLAAVVAAAAQLSATAAPPAPVPVEATSAQACEKIPQRVFVSTPYGTECIAYFISSPRAASPMAVFSFHGDFPAELMQPQRSASMAKVFQDRADRAAKAFSMPYIFVMRPGVLGSTGDHAKRRQPKEFHSMNAAIDKIKARYGIRSIAVSGQSGGGSVVGALLSLGRTDIVCAVPGSGAYDVVGLHKLRSVLAGKPATENRIAAYAARVYSPTEHIAQIPKDTGRRLFVVGDPRDKNTFFEQQRDFAYRVKAAGHHSMLLYAPGAGKLRHGMERVANEVAGLCMLGRTDEQIEQRMGDWWRLEFAKPKPKPANPDAPLQYSNQISPEMMLRFVTPEAPPAIPGPAQ